MLLEYGHPRLYVERLDVLGIAVHVVHCYEEVLASPADLDDVDSLGKVVTLLVHHLAPGKRVQ